MVRPRLTRGCYGSTPVWLVASMSNTAVHCPSDRVAVGFLNDCRTENWAFLGKTTTLVSDTS